MKNTRNQYGVKDSSDCYLTIEGKQYEQFTDFESKEDMEKQFPNDVFIKRGDRIYQLIK